MMSSLEEEGVGQEHVASEAASYLNVEENEVEGRGKNIEFMRRSYKYLPPLLE